MNEETREKIAQLQNIEQNINQLIAQKQQFQSQNIEVDNALTQLKDTKKVYRIIGNIMVVSTKDKVQKELDEKKELTELRLKTLDKQEDKMREKASALQKDVMEEMKNE